MACSQVTSGAMRDLECPVCRQVFRTPKILPCGHSVCGSPCLTQLAGDQCHVKCPECRASYPVPDGGVTNFPTNFFISRIVENTISRLSVDQSVCSGCSVDSVMLKRCYHCGSHICQNCRDQHTDIMKIGLIQQLAECSDKVASDKISLNEGTTMKNLKKTVSSMHEEVTRITESFHQIIDQRKLELSQSICDFETNEMSKIVAHRQQTKDSILAFCGEKQQTLIGEVSHMALVQTQEELTDMIEKYKTGASDIKVPNVALRVDEKQITQLLSTFGEIRIMHGGVVSGTLDIQRNFMDVKCCIGRRGSEPGFFNSPSAVQVSPRTGNIVVDDKNNGRIQIFSSEGEFVHTFRKPYYCESIMHLDVCNKGNIFMLNEGTKITSYTEKGQQLSAIDVLGAITFALAPNGYIHYGHNGRQVDVLNKGTPVTTYAAGDGVRADKICISKSGLVYVLHFNDGRSCKSANGKTDTMFIFNSQSQLISQTTVGVIKKEFCCTFTRTKACKAGTHPNIILWTSPRGSFRLINDKYFLTTDPETHAVTIYDLEWQLVKRIGSEGTTVGRLFHPRDAAVTLEGDVVVVSDNNMMQYF